MKGWDDLVAAALLGTSRAAPPDLAELGGGVGALVGRLPEDASPERRLLVLAAVLSLWTRAGRLPLPGHVPLPAPTAPDRRRPCPPRITQHLTTILQADMGPVLEEWLDTFASSGWSLPHRWLPELLDLARQRSELRVRILNLLDARGHWLIAQNPDWQDLFVPRDEDALMERWQSSPRHVRLTLLEHTRCRDQALSRRLLASTWSEDAYRDRAAFLAVLSNALGLDDEPFLEQALDDGRKEVRLVAADLLARLAGSELVSRVRERLSRLISLERARLGRDKLQVALPESCEPDMVRDGVLPKHPDGLGERAWWLLQMLAVVPPATWSESLGKSPAELVSLAAKTEYEAVLLEGWGRAAARHGDGAWAEALLRRWTEQAWSILAYKRSLYFVDDLPLLVQLAPQGRLEDWLVGLLREYRRALDESDVLLVLLREHRRPWGEALTRSLLQGMRPLAAKRSYPSWRWRAALVGFAHCAASSLADEAGRDWPVEQAGYAYWTENVDRFLSILRFRRTMGAAFREEGTGGPIA